MKNFLNFQTTGLLLIIGLIFYFGYFDTASISGFSNSYYSKVGDSIVLIPNKAMVLDYTTGVKASGVSGGGRTWLKDWASEGRVLNKKCLWEATVSDQTGNSKSISINGDAFLRGDDLICEIGQQDFFNTGAGNTEKFSNIKVTWLFELPPISDPQQESPTETPSEETQTQPNEIQTIDDETPLTETQVEVECVDNIGCVSYCGDKIPTCQENNCYCDDKKIIIDTTKLSTTQKINLWFDNLINKILGWFR